MNSDAVIIYSFHVCVAVPMQSFFFLIHGTILCVASDIACLRFSFFFFQGNFPTASVYAGSNCIELKGPEIIMDLTELLRFLTLCMLFSKKPFAVFLESAGYTHEDVLLQKPKAGVGHVNVIFFVL